MCIGILLPSLSGQYMCVWDPQKPEEGTEIPRIGVINSWDTMSAAGSLLCNQINPLSSYLVPSPVSYEKSQTDTQTISTFMSDLYIIGLQVRKLQMVRCSH